MHLLRGWHILCRNQNTITVLGRHFLIFVLQPSQIKKYINRAGQQFFNALCKRVTSSLQKRKYHKWFPVLIWLLIILKYLHRFYKCLTYEWRSHYQAQWNALNILKFHIFNDYTYIHTELIITTLKYLLLPSFSYHLC